MAAAAPVAAQAPAPAPSGAERGGPARPQSGATVVPGRGIAPPGDAGQGQDGFVVQAVRLLCFDRDPSIVVEGRGLNRFRLAMAGSGPLEAALLFQGRFQRLEPPQGSDTRVTFTVPEGIMQTGRPYQFAWRGLSGPWQSHPAPLIGCVDQPDPVADRRTETAIDAAPVVLGILRVVDAAGLAPASPLGLDAFVQRIRAAGYQDGQTRALDALGLVVVVIPVPPGADPAIVLAELSAAIPEAEFALNDSFAPASGSGRTYAREMMGGDAACRVQIGNLRLGLLDGPIARDALSNAFPRATVTDWQPDGGVGGDVAHASSVAHLLLDGITGPVSLDVASVLSGNGSALGAGAFDIASGLDWLVGRDVDLVLAPLTGSFNPLVEAALLGGAAKGVLFVAAAGNAGPEAPVAHPAASRWAFAVSAVDATGQPYTRGNRGPEVIVAAPGVDVWTPSYSLSGDPGGRYVTGSSFATPLAALAITQWLKDTPRDQRSGMGALSIRRDLARAIASGARDLFEPGRDAATGWGLARFVQCFGD